MYTGGRGGELVIVVYVSWISEGGAERPLGKVILVSPSRELKKITKNPHSKTDSGNCVDWGF